MTTPAAAPGAPTVRLIDPTGFDPGAAPLLMAARPVDLRGGRLGLLDNSKANSDAILWAIARLLDDEFEFANIYYAPQAQRLAAAPSRNAGRPASQRRLRHRRRGRLRRLLVGQSARRNYSGTPGHPRGHHHHQRVRHHCPRLHPADGRPRFPLPDVSAPHHQCQRRRLHERARALVPAVRSLLISGAPASGQVR